MSNSDSESAPAIAPAAPDAPTVARNRRKDLSGFVTSRSGDKTVKVTYEYKVAHPLYRKEVKRKTVVHAHDEKNECNVGDRVEIMETRPLSKLKRWRIVRVIEAAPLVG
jgi:small subunit ribosomal protein S17